MQLSLRAGKCPLRAAGIEVEGRSVRRRRVAGWRTKTSAIDRARVRCEREHERFLLSCCRPHLASSMWQAAIFDVVLLGDLFRYARHHRRVTDLASDDLLELLEDALQGVDEQELDRELAELVGATATQAEAARAVPDRPPLHRLRRSVQRHPPRCRYCSTRAGSSPGASGTVGQPRRRDDRSTRRRRRRALSEPIQTLTLDDERRQSSH
jgi:hypothetical protein